MSKEFLDIIKRSFNGLTAEEIKDACTVVIYSLDNVISMCYPMALICDICHQCRVHDGSDMDDILRCNEYDHSYCLRGLCSKCKENIKPGIIEEDVYECLLCSKNICGVCQKSQFFYHDECQESIIPLLQVYLPDEMCKIIIRLIF